jgi:hypothetical protein
VWDHFPDGLDAAAIETVFAEVAADAEGAPRPTSALLDGSAVERRRRRVERRALASVVRVVPHSIVAGMPGSGEGQVLWATEARGEVA